MAVTEFGNLSRWHWRLIGRGSGFLPGQCAAQVPLAHRGQRVEQLSRLAVRDLDGNAIILFDPNGRRDKPRRHLVPLLPDALACLDSIAKPRAGPHLYTVTSGESGAGYDVLGRPVRKVAAEMVRGGESVDPFTPGDIRRTVETRLAALGVPKETRAHLQSHGLSGVQDRHYNVHDYAGEELDALERLQRLALGEQKENVTPMRARKPK